MSTTSSTLIVVIYILLRIAQGAISLGAFGLSAYLRWGNTYIDSPYFYTSDSYYSYTSTSWLSPLAWISLSLTLATSATVATTALSALLTLKCARSRGLFQFLIWWDIFCVIGLWGPSVAVTAVSMDGLPKFQTMMGLNVGGLVLGLLCSIASWKMKGQERWAGKQQQVMVVVAPGVVVPRGQEGQWVPPPPPPSGGVYTTNSEVGNGGSYYGVHPKMQTRVDNVVTPQAVEVPIGR